MNRVIAACLSASLLACTGTAVAAPPDQVLRKNGVTVPFPCVPERDGEQYKCFRGGALFTARIFPNGITSADVERHIRKLTSDGHGELKTFKETDVEVLYGVRREGYDHMVRVYLRPRDGLVITIVADVGVIAGPGAMGTFCKRFLQGPVVP